MDSEWLVRHRETVLARILSEPRLSEEQRETLRRLDAHFMRRGLRLSTRVYYATRGKLLGIWLKKPFEKATREDLENYLDCTAKHNAPHTMELTKRFLRVFYRALLAPDDREYPPLVAWIRQAKASTLPKLPRDMVTKEEVLRLASATTSARDRSLVTVLYESAARVGEIVSARVGDVEFDEYGARITLRGKTGMRKVRIIDSVVDLSDWLNSHPRRLDRNSPLFVSMGHQNFMDPLMADGITRVLMRASRDSKLGRRVNPHLLRHSRLTELAKQLSESEIKIFAGWTADSPMAKVYIHLSGDDVDRKILEKRGLLTKEEVSRPDPLAAKTCVRCGAKNSAALTNCKTCKMPLDRKELEKAAEEYDLLRKNEGRLRWLLERLEDPRVVAILGERKRAGEAPA